MKSIRFMMNRPALRSISCCIATFLVLVCANSRADAEDAQAANKQSANGQIATGLACPDGFSVTQFASDEQASDIFCMTIDARGRVAAASRDYIRILEDTDSDGAADSVSNFAPAPEGGVQGMFFDGPHLYCSGGGGLVRYLDNNNDGKADGPAQMLFRVKTGNEHDAHAIRKGPDGWFYLTAGNFAGVSSNDVNSNESPVTRVREGVIMRFSPDFSRREVFAHGFRNTYDFDFDELGSLFTFESDGERDISLPWYRPTRVFMVQPGSDAGYISRSCKMPNDFFEMPDTVVELGRGSPTGVECYRHTQFPREFYNAVFVQDWTFGTVKCVKTHRDGVAISGTAEDFVWATGAFGFAPTDMAVAVDGSLLISVGGRGTRGSIYRVTSNDAVEKQANLVTVANNKTGNGAKSDLLTCLDARQPLSSWSRAAWEPKAQALGRDVLIGAVLDEELTTRQRCRAVEIVAEKFGPVPNELHDRLLAIQDNLVLARAGWMLGRTSDPALSSKTIAGLLGSPDRFVRIQTLHGLCGKRTIAPEVATALLLNLHNEDRGLRKAAANVLVAARVMLTRDPKDPVRLKTLYSSEWLALVIARGQVDPRGIQAGLGFFNVAKERVEKLDALRLIQLSMGDVGPRPQFSGNEESQLPVFDGYQSRSTLTAANLIEPRFQKMMSEMFPTNDELVDYELARVCAIGELIEPELPAKLLGKITADSNPVHDIHYLVCLAKLGSPTTPESRVRIADALVNLQGKIESRKLNQDSNWELRVEEIVQRHQLKDPAITQQFIAAENFGHPAHCMFLRNAPADLVAQAIPRFIAFQSQAARPQWSPQLLRHLAESPVSDHRQLVRRQFDDPGCRDDVVRTLALRPSEIDRGIFVEGLKSPEPGVVGASLNALESMQPAAEVTEQIALVRALQRLGGEKTDYMMREQIVRQLQKNTGTGFGFQFGTQGHRPQTTVINRWVDEMKQRYPDKADQLQPEAGVGPAEIAALTATIPWQSGSTERGHVVYEQRQCAKCHGSRNSLGPDLAGVTARFSREDLLAAVLAPSATVSSRYRTKLFETVDGKTYTGMVIYESIDGVLLRTANNDTLRLEHDDIESSEFLTRSLMPSGLMEECTPQDYADLYAYMLQLQ